MLDLIYHNNNKPPNLITNQSFFVSDYSIINRKRLIMLKGPAEGVSCGMKIAIIYNRDSQAVINLFGTPNREVYGLQTINLIKEALLLKGHQVRDFEGDKNIVYALEDFMPAVVSGERPGLVLNLSYGIQGRARYTHIPAILEMLGIPYVGSGPETHAVALDKVLTKIVLLQKGLPTPRFTVIESPDFSFPLSEDLFFPLIIKPKNEAVSFGLRIVNNEEELREGVQAVYDNYRSPSLIEEYIEGREINIGLLGNNPVQALPAVELIFQEGLPIYTYEDKMNLSSKRVEKICPADLQPEQNSLLQSLARDAFNSLGCFDSARVDFRLDRAGNPYILEVNSMASLNPEGSYAYAAAQIGLDYSDLVNRLIEVARHRYFGPFSPEEVSIALPDNKQQFAFTCLTQNRDSLEDDLKNWTNLTSRTNDPVGLGTAVNYFKEQMIALDMEEIETHTSPHFAWIWQTQAGLPGGTLLVCPIDIPRESVGDYSVPFRRDPERFYGEGVASSRAGLVCLIHALKTLHLCDSLHQIPLGVFIYADKGKGMSYSSQTLQAASQKAGRVLVIQPGFKGGKIIDQRRGSRKYSILVEGEFQRIGATTGAGDIMSWFLKQAGQLLTLNRPEERLTIAIQQVQSQHYSILLPHHIQATVYITFLDTYLADEAEAEIFRLFKPSAKEGSMVRCKAEKLEGRPPLKRSKNNNILIELLRAISNRWQIPFGIEASLYPSAAGVVADDIPVICGLGPACENLYTPHESVNRGELLQRTLLLTLFLLETS